MWPYAIKRMETRDLGGKISSTALRSQCFREPSVSGNIFYVIILPIVSLQKLTSVMHIAERSRVYKQLRAMVDPIQDLRHCAEGFAALAW